MCTIPQLFLSTQNVLQHAVSFLTGGTECVCCGCRSYDGIPLCSRCRLYLPECGMRAESPVCTICGKPLISEQSTCLQCRTERLIFHADIVYPLYPYRLWRKELLISWKIRGARQLSPFFAGKIHSAVCLLEKETGKTDLPLIPVPPRPGKIRSTGWDQIDELCRYLSCCYHHRILALLKRTSGLQQKHMSRSERISRQYAAYELLPEQDRKRKKCQNLPDTAILIDDLMTTGVTIETCARILKEAGVHSVYAVLLFTAD